MSGAPLLDDDFGEDIDALNDVDHLPDAEEMGGTARTHTTEYGGDSLPSVGRAYTPPMWAHQSTFPQVRQLRVWMLDNGIQTSVGTIPGGASEEDLIRRYPNAMPQPGDGYHTFILRPVDNLGGPVGQEFSLQISEHHAALRSARKGSSDAPNGGSVFGLGFDPGTLITRSLDNAQAERQRAESIMTAERERYTELQAQTAQERVDLAGNAVETVQTMAQRMMDADHARADSWQQSQAAQSENMLAGQGKLYESLAEMQAGNTNTVMQILAQQASRQEDSRRHELEDLRRRQEDERARRLAEEERLRDRLNSDRQRDREDFQYRLEVMKLEAKEREAGREREAQRQQLMGQHEQDRQRQHSERMMQLQMAALNQSNGTNFLESAVKWAGMAKAAGIDLGDVVGRVMGRTDGADMEGWASLAETVVQGGGEIVKEAIRAKAAVTTKKTEAETTKAVAQLQVDSLSQGIDWDDLEDEDEDDDLDELAETIDSSKASGPTPQSQAPTHMTLSDEREARGAARELVTEIRSLPVESWQSILVRIIQRTPSLVALCKEEGVRNVATQAGASPEMAALLVEALQASPLVPPEIIGE